MSLFFIFFIYSFLIFLYSLYIYKSALPFYKPLTYQPNPNKPPIDLHKEYNTICIVCQLYELFGLQY